MESGGGIGLCERKTTRPMLIFSPTASNLTDTLGDGESVVFFVSKRQSCVLQVLSDRKDEGGYLVDCGK
ncbi:hypothetical protein K439DRAFT_378077 [Ramaria rubella]|nr:hypothetical protein K439DRAFT_378077 [Ramaria rubella]